jgi:hypothetical protein
LLRRVRQLDIELDELLYDLDARAAHTCRWGG